MSLLGSIALVAFAIGLLLTLVLVLRLHAFLALLATTFVVALVGGIAVEEIAGEIQRSMGGTLGYISIVIGLGAIFGEILQAAGGTSAIARALIQAWGEHRASLALGVTGLLVAIPVFFDVAFILLVPLLYGLAVSTRRPLLEFALPLLAGLAVAHAFVPPTPGPTAVAGILGADLGWVILFGLLAGAPALLVGGFWFGRRVAQRIPGQVPEHFQAEPEEAASVSVGVAVGLIALPLMLILAATASKALLPDASQLRAALQLVGHPFFALLLAVLLAARWLVGTDGYTRQDLLELSNKAFEPIGLILMVTGVGGVLGKVLVAAGVGEALASGMDAVNLPIVLFAFAIAAVIRVAQGSATVAMVTAGGLIAPVVEAGSYSAPLLGATTVAIAAGATIFSHVNDSGFWLVGRYLGLTEKETLQSWTVVTTLVGGTGFVVTWLLSLFL